MNKNINIGLVEFGDCAHNLQLNHFSNSSGYTIKKVLVSDKSSAGIFQAQHPKTEIVYDKTSILFDPSIDLIIVLSPKRKDLNIVGEILQTGKQVRIL